MKTISSLLCVCLLLCLSKNTFAQVPKLNSFPSASAVIFLDFDGHLVDGTSWNGSGPFYCDGANLNTAQITEVFYRVSEDYRPFNINITTDSTVYESAPANRRTRVVITSSSSWYGAAGGTAFTNSFTWGDNTPCFVFSNMLGYGAKAVAEAASHEAGHTLGLSHQSSYDTACNKLTEYNAGIGSGEIGWAPIMGVGYYRNQTLWHYGTNPYGCNYMQDDLGVITNPANGFGYRADDHGDTTTTATVASFVNNKFSVDGIIERPNDVDMIKFTLSNQDHFQLNATPYSVASGDNGANLDMQVELLSDNQTVLGVYNPPTLLSASIDTVLAAGTYYLRVRGTGNAYAPDFASLGSYSVGIDIVSSTLPLHKLALKATIEGGRHNLDWEIVADERVVSQSLEVATDGQNFQPLATVAAASRSYGYVPSKEALYYYRLRVVFDNGQQFYSNVTVLRSGASNSRPSLIGNVVMERLSINNPASFAYAILDMNGRVVAKGQLSQGLNAVSTSLLTHGLYIIQFTNNGEQYTEKFMKQ